MRFGRKEAARHNKLYESNSQVPGHRHFQDEVAGEQAPDISKVATVDPVLAEAEKSIGTLPRYWSWLRLQNAPAWLFVLFALPIVIFFDVTVPPGEVPDEPFHILRAASILNGEIIGHRATVASNGTSVAVSGVYVDRQLLFAASGLWPMTGEPKMTRTISGRLGGLRWTGNHDFIPAPNTAIYFPAFYLPAALGLGIARLAGVQPFHAIIVGRLVDSLCYVLIGYFALLIARRCRLLLFVTLMVPMSLSLAASFSMDSGLIAFSVLASALLTRSEAGDKWAEICFWLAGLALALVFVSKPPYLLFGILMLQPTRGHAAPGRSLRARAGGFLLAVLPALVWAGTGVRHAITPFPRADYHPGPLYPGDHNMVFHSTDPGAQLQVFLADPWRLFTMPFQAMMLQAKWLFREMIGVLGWSDIVLPSSIYLLWTAAFAAACLGDVLGDKDEKPGPAPPDSVIVLCAGIATTFVIFIFQYLTWASVGNPEILEVRGRYLLPILALTALAIPRIRFAGGDVWRTAFAAVPVVASAAGLVALPIAIVRRYYLQ
jgi:hypothetical protein